MYSHGKEGERGDAAGIARSSHSPIDPPDPSSTHNVLTHSNSPLAFFLAYSSILPITLTVSPTRISFLAYVFVLVFSPSLAVVPASPRASLWASSSTALAVLRASLSSFEGKVTLLLGPGSVCALDAAAVVDCDTVTGDSLIVIGRTCIPSPSSTKIVSEVLNTSRRGRGLRDTPSTHS